jgi:hypothetical protein
MKTIEQRVSRRHGHATHRNFIEHPLFGLGEPKKLAGRFGERLRQLHLPEQRADDEDRR